MGFMFAHVMAFYSHDYDKVMKLPVRVFWHLVDQIPRIEAYRAKRALSIAACSQSTQGFEEMSASLNNELGAVVVGAEPAKVIHPSEIPIPTKEQQERAWDTLAALM